MRDHSNIFSGKMEIALYFADIPKGLNSHVFYQLRFDFTQHQEPPGFSDCLTGGIKDIASDGKGLPQGMIKPSL